MNNDDLFIACVNGNTKAKEILYKKFNNILFSICLKYFKNHDDSMDYLHDGFIHIFDKLLKMDSNKNVNLNAWLRVVMRNYCLDIIRKKKRNVTHIDLENSSYNMVDESEFKISISHNTLLSLVDRLPSQYKKVFVMYAVEDLTHKDISNELGISENTSKTNFFRARKKLRKSLYDLDYID